jgi:hypothetical protein
VRPEGIKNSNDTIGNRIQDLPVCRAVPHPSANPRASIPGRGWNFSLGHHVVTGSGIYSASHAKSTVDPLEGIWGFGGGLGGAHWLTHVSVLAEYSVAAPLTH